jgi:hypothetical protein
MVVSIWNVYGNYIGGIGGLKIQNVGVWQNINSKKKERKYG